MKILEKQVTNYHQGSLNEEENEKKESNKEMLSNHSTIDLDQYFEANQSLNKFQNEEIELQNLGEQQALQIQPPYGQPGSSK